jgi:hypothetical protein
MEQCKALSIIKQMPENKAQIDSFIKAAENEILSGFFNPLEVEKQLKIMEELITGLRKNPKIREQLLNELDKYSEKTISAFGVDFTKGNRTTYDYSTCNDSELEKLMADKKMLDEKIKSRQEMLKNIQPNAAVNPETGEYLLQPIKKTTEFVSIKIK